MLRLLPVLLLPILLTACTTPAQRADSDAYMVSAEFAERPPIQGSLFASDQAVLSDEAIQRILSGRVELPSGARVAVLKYPDAQPWGLRVYGRGYWASAEYLRLQQQHVEVLSRALLQAPLIADVLPLPDMMTPKEMSIPVLREAAVRLQADMLLVFRVSADTFTEYRFLARDRVRVFSTCELILLDVRTGLVPFARVVTREREEQRLPDDTSVSETVRRAQTSAIALTVEAGAMELVDFIGRIPQKPD